MGKIQRRFPRKQGASSTRYYRLRRKFQKFYFGSKFLSFTFTDTVEPKEKIQQEPKNVTKRDLYNLIVKLREDIASISTQNQEILTRHAARDQVLNVMPLRNMSAMRDFTEMLNEKHINVAFEEWVKTAKVTEVMGDELMQDINFSGKHNKVCLKDEIFFKVWKDATILNNFEKVIKIEIAKAKNRANQRKMREKRKTHADGDADDDGIEYVDVVDVKDELIYLEDE